MTIPICIKHKALLTTKANGFSSHICLECLEEQEILSAQNMGVPDYFYCGYCGSKCTQEEIVVHCTTKKCIIGLVEDV